MSKSLIERVNDHAFSYVEKGQQVQTYYLSDKELVEVAEMQATLAMPFVSPSIAMQKLPLHPENKVLLNRVANEVVGGRICGVPVMAKRLLTTVQFRPKYRYC